MEESWLRLQNEFERNGLKSKWFKKARQQLTPCRCCVSRKSAVFFSSNDNPGTGFSGYGAVVSHFLGLKKAARAESDKVATKKRKAADGIEAAAELDLGTRGDQAFLEAYSEGYEAARRVVFAALREADPV